MLEYPCLKRRIQGRRSIVVKTGRNGVISVFLVLALFLPVFPFRAFGDRPSAFSVELALPEGWTLQDGFEKPLTRNVENGGRWIVCSLRAPSGDSVLLQILPREESGPLTIPSLSDIRTDGFLGMGATYQVVNESSFKAIAETHPYLGGSVATSLAGGDTLVVESRTLPLESLLDLCRFFAGSETAPPPSPGLQ
jgi:hypothetical protein